MPLRKCGQCSPALHKAQAAQTDKSPRKTCTEVPPVSLPPPAVHSCHIRATFLQAPRLNVGGAAPPPCFPLPPSSCARFLHQVTLLQTLSLLLTPPHTHTHALSSPLRPAPAPRTCCVAPVVADGRHEAVLGGRELVAEHGPLEAQHGVKGDGLADLEGGAAQVLEAHEVQHQHLQG